MFTYMYMRDTSESITVYSKYFNIFGRKAFSAHRNESDIFNGNVLIALIQCSTCGLSIRYTNIYLQWWLKEGLKRNSPSPWKKHLLLVRTIQMMDDRLNWQCWDKGKNIWVFEGRVCRDLNPHMPRSSFVNPWLARGPNSVLCDGHLCV